MHVVLQKKSIHPPTSPNSLLFHSVKMEEAGHGKVCPAVHSPFSVQAVDGDQVQTGWGAGRQWRVFRIRLFRLEETLAYLGQPSLFSACPESRQQIVAVKHQFRFRPSSDPFASPLYYVFFFFFCHKGALVGPGKDNIQKGAYSCQLDLCWRAGAGHKKKISSLLIRLSC